MHILNNLDANWEQGVGNTGGLHLMVDKMKLSFFWSIRIVGNLRALRCPWSAETLQLNCGQLEGVLIMSSSKRTQKTHIEPSALLYSSLLSHLPWPDDVGTLRWPEPWVPSHPWTGSEGRAKKQQRWVTTSWLGLWEEARSGGYVHMSKLKQ